MWANAQPDGRPAEYSGALCTTPQSLAVPCSNAAKTRNPLKETSSLKVKITDGRQ